MGSKRQLAAKSLTRLSNVAKNSSSLAVHFRNTCHQVYIQQAVREAVTICPRPSSHSVGAEAPRAAEPTAPADRNVAVGSHGQYVPTVTAAAA